MSIKVFNNWTYKLLLNSTFKAPSYEGLIFIICYLFYAIYLICYLLNIIKRNILKSKT